MNLGYKSIDIANYKLTQTNIKCTYCTNKYNNKHYIITKALGLTQDTTTMLYLLFNTKMQYLSHLPETNELILKVNFLLFSY